MGLLDRMGQAIRAQVNSLIQENQDPEKLLEKAILEMEGELYKCDKPWRQPSLPRNVPSANDNNRKKRPKLGTNAPN